jgi:hypothetical protein
VSTSTASSSSVVLFPVVLASSSRAMNPVRARAMASSARYSRPLRCDEVVQDRVHVPGELGGAFGFLGGDAQQRQRCQARVVVHESHGPTLRSGVLTVSDGLQEPLLREGVAAQLEGPQRGRGAVTDLDAPVFDADQVPGADGGPCAGVPPVAAFEPVHWFGCDRPDLSVVADGQGSSGGGEPHLYRHAGLRPCGRVLAVGPAWLGVVGSWVMVIRLSSGLVLVVGVFVRRL